MEQFQLPPIVQERIKALASEMRQLEEQIKQRESLVTQFVDGVLIGAGVDVVNSDITVNLETMTASIAPKGNGLDLSTITESAEEKQD